MKKFTLFIILLAITFAGTVSASAQYVVKKETTQVVVDNPDGTSVVSICTTSPQDDKVTIRVAGMEIVLGNNSGSVTSASAKKTVQKTRRTSVAFGGSYQAFLEVGVNMLPSPDYSLYSGMNLGVPSDFMMLNNMKSLQWALSITDMALYLNRSRTIALSMGLQAVFDDYTFSEQLTLVKEGGMLIPEMIDNKYKKSKLTTFSLKVPVLFHIGSGRSFNLSAGVYGGVVLAAHTKIKKPVERMYDPYVSPFYYGVTARLGYKDYYVYANYGLSEMFKKDRGPVVAPITIGLGIGF